MTRTGRTIICVGACLAALAAGCGSSAKKAAPPATTTTVKQTAPFTVGRKTVTFVDRTRTPARTLKTIIDYPTTGGPYPMVVYLHGLGAHADNPYLQPLAAAGFVAVAPTEPFTNADTPGGPRQSDAVNIPADIRFVIAQVPRDPDLAKVIDPNAIGLLGASLGAAMADQVAYGAGAHDARIKAVIEQSCGCATPTAAAGGAPLMFMQGTADPVVSYQKTAENFTVAHSPKYFVTLIQAKHIQYDEPWLSISIRAATDFFAGYLHNEAAALQRLPADATVAGTSSFQSG